MDSNQMNNQGTGSTNNGYQADNYTNSGNNYTNTNGYTNSNAFTNSDTYANSNDYNNSNNGAYDYQTGAQAYNNYGTQNQYTTYTNATVTSPVIEESRKGRGFVGALIGALIGGAIWTAIGCLGFVSGWIAILIFFLAQFGYKKMAGKLDKFGVVISVILGIVMIFPATCASYAFFIMKELNDGPTSHFTYMDVISDFFMYIERYEQWPSLIKNLFMGYAFTAVAGIYMGASALGGKLNARKAAKKQGK